MPPCFLATAILLLASLSHLETALTPVLAYEKEAASVTLHEDEGDNYNYEKGAYDGHEVTIRPPAH